MRNNGVQLQSLTMSELAAVSIVIHTGGRRIGFLTIRRKGAISNLKQYDFTIAFC